MNIKKLDFQLKNIYNDLPCACMAVDADGIVINVNNTFLNYTGYDRDHILNKFKLNDFLINGKEDFIDQTTNPICPSNTRSDTANLNLLTKNGEILPCSISSQVVKDEFAKPQFYHYTFIDISDLVLSTEINMRGKIKMEQSDLKIKKLTAEIQDLSHIITNEIQTPLKNILGLTSLLKKKYVNSFDVSGSLFLDFINASGEKMRRQFSDLHVKFTQSKNIINKEYVNLNEVLDDVLYKLEDAIEQSKVVIEIPVSLPILFGVYQDLKQLFYNLIKNAIQYKKGNVAPKVTVSFDEDEDFYHFTIADNGRGIHQDYHQKIFEEYFHLASDAADCSGRGLAESRVIVENHKGTIGVVSSYGNGCTIYFNIEK
ncbi:PAS domain-containing sensor histidine kinase [Anditalea andensis]|uniref:histidine kinase n=1 Tax=Anditalea andensis TaxID=1048983 RepID=A0A074LN32_9BACT|nr:ATP-binding protein [Anditalea andensis]KEO75317.1 hypothetical protein EL17_01900 [Anditalea andensis]